MAFRFTGKPFYLPSTNLIPNVNTYLSRPFSQDIVLFPFALFAVSDVVS